MVGIEASLESTSLKVRFAVRQRTDTARLRPYDQAIWREATAALPAADGPLMRPPLPRSSIAIGATARMGVYDSVKQRLHQSAEPDISDCSLNAGSRIVKTPLSAENGSLRADEHNDQCY